ncbi:MAG: Peptide chain release factor N(5)-glutamine methyltransferase, partial [Firmicutes bacterium]|nr:Peptide chain release factor N(5)-glutamine methyltransferase [Bacillota bacterium]
MQTVWRIKDLLEWTTRYFLDKGISESRLEAEILLAHVLKKDRVYLYANYEAPVNTDERAIYKEYIKRRAKSEPIAYITGHKEFMSLDFEVSPQVLIPRPDTELLVETAIKLSCDLNAIRIVDVGTGSGAIAVSLAYY